MALQRRYEANMNSFMGDIKDAQKRYSLGCRSIRKVAEEQGALIKVGKCVRYNFNILDDFFMNQSGKEL